MRSSAIVSLLLLFGCAPAERAPAREVPLWAFGEGSDRTDPLPAELDSLIAWGDYDAGARPVAYAVDLNGDANPEWLVRSDKRLCGQFGGCPTRLIARKADGTLTDLLDNTLAKVVYATNRRVNGWPVLWLWVGGVDGGVFRLEYREGAYRAAGTLRSWRDVSEWSNEQIQRDTLYRLLNAAPRR